MESKKAVPRSIFQNSADFEVETLENLWKKQQDYNTVIKFQENEFDPEEWTQTYLTGLVSEFDEVLDAINWKRHRRSNTHVDRTNLAYELADMTKYIISMWEVWGFSAQDMLTFCHIKSDMMDQLLNQETSIPPRGSKVLISDIDGTLGDWRATFLDWLKARNVPAPDDDPVTSLLMDTDLSMKYSEYNELKSEFERTGGYQNIYPYDDVLNIVRELQTDPDFYLIITTARPVDEYKRIWLDTWLWLMKQGLNPRELHIGAEPRILRANHIKNLVSLIVFEDNPGLALRAASEGIRVFVKKQSYNKDLNHENIKMVDDFSRLDPRNIWTTGE